MGQTWLPVGLQPQNRVRMSHRPGYGLFTHLALVRPLLKGIRKTIWTGSIRFPRSPRCCERWCSAVLCQFIGADRLHLLRDQCTTVAVRASLPAGQNMFVNSTVFDFRVTSTLSTVKLQGQVYLTPWLVIGECAKFQDNQSRFTLAAIGGSRYYTVRLRSISLTSQLHISRSHSYCF
jgi:hypothetical protein